jgi:hypothetical protein
LSPQIPEIKRKAFELLLESLLALRRENKEVLWSSMIKDTMKRKKPSFNESYHGYRTFSELLEDAQAQGIVELDTDKRSRTYVVTRFGSEVSAGRPTASAAARISDSSSGKTVRKRRRGNSSNRRRPAAAEEAPAPLPAPAANGSPPPAPEPPPADAKAKAASDVWAAAVELGIEPS